LYVGQSGNVEIGHVFRKKYIKNPGEPLFSACSFLRYWAGLQPEETQKLINYGVDLMVGMAVKLLGKKNNKRSRMTLQDATSDDEDRSPEEA
jgi:hypothetical protein